MSILRSGMAVVMAAVAVGQLQSADSTSVEAAPKEPSLQLVLPLGIPTGLPQRITVRGRDLSGTTSARLVGLNPSPVLRVLGSGTAPTGEAGDLVGVGTEWMDLEVLLPEGTLRGTNGSLVLSSPAGQSLPFPIFITPGGVTPEREPNDEFEMAQDFPRGSLVRGTIANASDLDIFRIELRSGQTLHAELWSAKVLGERRR